MGFEWNGGDAGDCHEMDRLHQLESACLEAHRELSHLEASAATRAAAGTFQMPQQLAVIMAWVRASLRNGGALPPPGESPPPFRM